MKALLLTMLTLLVLIGCSSEESTYNPTQPTIIEENEAIQAIENDNGDRPVTDIEPGEPLCLTENFGWVELSNPQGRPVRVDIGTDISVTVAAGSDLIIEVDAGWHELTWQTKHQRPYTELVPVSTCDTTEITYQAGMSYKARAMQ